MVNIFADNRKILVLLFYTSPLFFALFKGRAGGREGVEPLISYNPPASVRFLLCPLLLWLRACLLWKDLIKHNLNVPIYFP